MMKTVTGLPARTIFSSFPLGEADAADVMVDAGPL